MMQYSATTVYCDNTASKNLNKKAQTFQRKSTFVARSSSRPGSRSNNGSRGSSRDSIGSIGRGSSRVSSSIYKKSNRVRERERGWRRDTDRREPERERKKRVEEM